MLSCCRMGVIRRGLNCEFAGDLGCFGGGGDVSSSACIRLLLFTFPPSSSSSPALANFPLTNRSFVPSLIILCCCKRSHLFLGRRGRQSDARRSIGCASKKELSPQHGPSEGAKVPVSRKWKIREESGYRGDGVMRGRG